MLTCDNCGSRERVEAFYGGYKACDDCVLASMPAYVTVFPSWTRNEHHLAGLAYTKEAS